MTVLCLFLLVCPGFADNRAAWQQPSRVIADLGIARGGSVADIGCGEGYFTLRLAKAVNESGRVFAVDIVAGSLDVLKKAAAQQHLTNLVVILSDPTDTKLQPESVSIVFICNVLHMVPPAQRLPLLKNIVQALTPGGFLYLIDWRKSRDVPFESYDRIIPREELLTLCARTGLRLDAEFQYLKYQWFFRFQKPGQVYAEADNVDEEIEMLEKALGENANAERRAGILRQILLTQLGADRLEAAQARFRKASDTDLTLAAAALGPIESYLRAKQSNKELAKWCATLSAYAFSEDASAMIASEYLQALYRIGNSNEVHRVMSEYVGRFSPAISRDVLNYVVGFLMARKNYKDASTLVDFAEKQSLGDPEWMGFAMAMRTSLLIGEGQWDAAVALFRKTAQTTPDAYTTAMIRRLGEAGIGAGKTELVDNLCNFVFKELKNKSTTREAAAAFWVMSARSAGEAPKMVERLSTLKSMGMDGNFLTFLTRAVYLDVLAKNEPGSSVALLTFCEALAPDVTTKEAQSALTSI
ncbi:MAG: class I SAM-dependent methyltransferase, partial [Verrucomicrobiota bacterium]